jgi:Fe-S-cluster containining protein
MDDKFVCQMCGKCCGNIPLRPNFFQQHKGKAQKPYTLSKPNFIKDKNYIQPVTQDGYCVFLRCNNTCAIYDDRPDVCKLQGHINKLPCFFKNIKP